MESHYEFHFAQTYLISLLAERAEKWRWGNGMREPGEYVASSSCVISFSAQDYLLVQSQIKHSAPGEKGPRV